jgi:hypothetical protein
MFARAVYNQYTALFVLMDAKTGVHTMADNNINIGAMPVVPEVPVTTDAEMDDALRQSIEQQVQEETTDVLNTIPLAQNLTLDETIAVGRVVMMLRSGRIPLNTFAAATGEYLAPNPVHTSRLAHYTRDGWLFDNEGGQNVIKNAFTTPRRLAFILVTIDFIGSMFQFLLDRKHVLFSNLKAPVEILEVIQQLHDFNKGRFILVVECDDLALIHPNQPLPMIQPKLSDVKFNVDEEP